MNKILEINKSNCSGCFSCVNACPKKCIKMVSDEEGFLYPQTNTALCISCGVCEKACPIIKGVEKNTASSAFAVINKDEKTRLKSSSGGIFTLLAKEVLEDGGVVFGAAFNNDFTKVQHISVSKIEELSKLQGSKYLQSIIGDTYNQAKVFLDKGITVYFSGTPCQIAGLYAFLQKKYDNLITQNIICHGVPSPLVWRKYVGLQEQKSSSKTQNVFFRHKKRGWKAYSLQFEFENGKEYIQSIKDDLYMRGFLSDIYLRPSCYVCNFKGVNQCSDITLADFWGVENICADMHDDKGTSLLILNSEKGKSLFTLISDSTVNKEVDLDAAISFNLAATKSVAEPKKRKEFFAEFNNIPTEKIFQKYCSLPLKVKCRRLVVRILRKMKLK